MIFDSLRLENTSSRYADITVNVQILVMIEFSCGSGVSKIDIICAVMLAQLQHVFLISPNGVLTFWTSQGRKNTKLWLDAAELTYPDQK